MKDVKKSMKLLIENGSKNGVISEVAFFNIIQEENDKREKTYQYYVESCFYKRINDKISFLESIKNIQDTYMFREMTMCITGYLFHKPILFSNSKLFYLESAKYLICFLYQFKKIMFLYSFYTDYRYNYDEIDENHNCFKDFSAFCYDDDDEYILDHDFNVEYKKTKLNKLINILKKNNFLEHCMSCKQYQENKKIQKHNRWYEENFYTFFNYRKPKNVSYLLTGSFDYLLVENLKRGNVEFVMEMTKGQSDFIISKSKYNIVKDYIQKISTKYNDDGSRNQKTHNEFKKHLKESMSNMCIITNTELKPNSNVEHCHIKPYKVATYDEAIDGDNGIFLLHDFHVMFDKGFITFDNNGLLLISPFITDDERKKINNLYIEKEIDDIKNNKKRQKYLKYHREYIFKSGVFSTDDINFNFDESINDWNIRKDMVEYYILKTNLLNIDVDSSKKMIFRLYDYILYSIDKSLLKPNEPSLDKNHYEKLCNIIKGVDGYMDKRNGKKYKKNIKYCDFNIDKENNNKQKRSNFIKENNCLFEQINNYENLINLTKKINKDTLYNSHNIIKTNFNKALYSDIKECKGAVNSVNLVNNGQGFVYSHYSKFKDFEFEYTEKNIRKILNNWKLVKENAYQNPYNYIHIIYLDVINAIENIKLTDKQKKILYDKLNDINDDANNSGSLSEIIKKITNFLSKNN